MATDQREHEVRWVCAFAGVLVLGSAAAIQFVLGEMPAEEIEKMPPFLVVLYAMTGKFIVTIPLALLGGALLLKDLTRAGHRQNTIAPKKPKPTAVAPRAKPAAWSKPAPVAAPEEVPAAAADVQEAAEEPSAPPQGGKIRGGWHPGVSAGRGTKVNTTEDGQEVTAEGPLGLPPTTRGDGKRGRVKLATERYMNWDKREE
jgi:hypothetical protein